MKGPLMACSWQPETFQIRYPRYDAHTIPSVSSAVYSSMSGADFEYTKCRARDIIPLRGWGTFADLRLYAPSRSRIIEYSTGHRSPVQARTEPSYSGLWCTAVSSSTDWASEYRRARQYSEPWRSWSCGAACKQSSRNRCKRVGNRN